MNQCAAPPARRNVNPRSRWNCREARALVRWTARPKPSEHFCTGGRLQIWPPNEMLSFEHCLVRAERLRILMLTASDPTAEIRLRGFVHKYKDLAGRAKRLTEVKNLRRLTPIQAPNRGH